VDTTPRDATVCRMQLARSPYPAIAGIFVVCTLAGVWLGVEFLSPEWSLVRKVAGGAVSGAGVALLCTATRLFS
jgi:hypothetical protein